MIILITDRVDHLTNLEQGVEVVPPFSHLSDNRYAAAVIAVSHDLRHNTRFQRWVEDEVRSRLLADSYDYVLNVPCGPVERPALECNQAQFRHVPDGRMFAVGPDVMGSVWTYTKIAPLACVADAVSYLDHAGDAGAPVHANAILTTPEYEPEYLNIAPDTVVELYADQEPAAQG